VRCLQPFSLCYQSLFNAMLRLQRHTLVPGLRGLLFSQDGSGDALVALCTRTPKLGNGCLVRYESCCQLALNRAQSLLSQAGRVAQFSVPLQELVVPLLKGLKTHAPRGLRELKCLEERVEAVENVALVALPQRRDVNELAKLSVLDNESIGIANLISGEVLTAHSAAGAQQLHGILPASS
jgi:hypothetical protein